MSKGHYRSPPYSDIPPEPCIGQNQVPSICIILGWSIIRCFTVCCGFTAGNLCGESGVFVDVKLCSSISVSGDLMTGREPQMRNELSAVVTIEHSSLEVTICTCGMASITWHT